MGFIVPLIWGQLLMWVVTDVSGTHGFSRTVRSLEMKGRVLSIVESTSSASVIFTQTLFPTFATEHFIYFSILKSLLGGEVEGMLMMPHSHHRCPLRGKPSVDGGAAMHINNEVVPVEEDVSVVIEINVVDEWMGSLTSLLLVPRYNWVPHEAGLYVSYFNIGLSLDDFRDRVNLVAEAADAECFKLVICKKTKHACHGMESYMFDFFLHIFYYLSRHVRSASVLRFPNGRVTGVEYGSHPTSSERVGIYAGVCHHLKGPRSNFDAHVIFGDYLGKICNDVSGDRDMINQLPCKASSRDLIGYLDSDALCTRVFGKCFIMKKCKRQGGGYILLSPLPKATALTQTVQDPRLARPSPRSFDPTIVTVMPPKDKGKRKSSKEKSSFSLKK
ncbi:hypothetical protein V8G54_009425 [Vigna mungo]|uniref:Uncharacterized protein n=1 Tax=Vigna mungo TaxID=3915 RepID=A0AAQ3S4U6_VIGMU